MAGAPADRTLAGPSHPSEGSVPHGETGFMTRFEHLPALLRAAGAGLMTAGVILAASLPGSWDVYGAPPLEVTPRGTAPILPPGATPPATPTPLLPARTSPGTDDSGQTGTTPAILVPPPAAPPGVEPADQMAPIPAAGEVALPSGGEVRVALPYGAVTARVPGAPVPSQLRHKEVALSGEQQGAAADRGLLATNIAFLLEIDPPVTSAPEFTLLVQYVPEQVAGIDAGSLALFWWDSLGRQWIKLEACAHGESQRRVQCTSHRPGIFLLAGEPPKTGIPGQGGAHPPGDSPLPWWLVLLPAGVAALALAVRRRLRTGEA